MSTQKPIPVLHNDLIAPNDGFEINYLQQRIGVSHDDILKAIATVGNGRREVVAYLEKLKKEGAASPPHAQLN